MHNANRISSIIALDDEDEQFEELLELSDSLSAGEERELAEEEIRGLIEWLDSDCPAECRSAAWAVLLNVEGQEQLVDFAVKVSKNQSSERRYAVQYLRMYKPQVFADQLEELSAVEDPDVQYEVAQYHLKDNPGLAMQIMISILRDVSADNADGILFYLAEQGSKEHFDKCIELDAKCGGGSIYGQAAEAIASRIAG